MKIKIYDLKDIKKSYREGFEKGVQQCIDDVVAVVALCLTDKHGFTPEDIKRFEDEVNETFESVFQKRISLDDIADAKKEEIDSVPTYHDFKKLLEKFEKSDIIPIVPVLFYYTDEEYDMLYTEYGDSIKYYKVPAEVSNAKS